MHSPEKILYSVCFSIAIWSKYVAVLVSEVASTGHQAK